MPATIVFGGKSNKDKVLDLIPDSFDALASSASLSEATGMGLDVVRECLFTLYKGGFVERKWVPTSLIGHGKTSFAYIYRRVDGQ